MKKKRLLAFPLFLLSGGLFALSGCSGIFGETGEYTIAGTNVQTNENGDTVVTITWEDEELDPLSFVIPASIAGEDGVGIKNISYEVSEDGSTLTVRISYTDESRDTVIAVPIKSGRGVAAVVLGTGDNDGKFCFTYTDGTQSDWISLPVGISSVSTDYDEQTNSTTITIVLSDGTKKTFTITHGTNGAGVSSIARDEANDTDEAYSFVIEYTDGSSGTFLIPKPQDGKDGSQWLTGATAPSSELGAEGDFYLNTTNGYLYRKENGAWSFLFSIKSKDSEEVYYIVTFSANGGVLTDSQGNEMKNSDGVARDSLSLQAKAGSVFGASALPLAKKDGYVFEGWFTGTVTTDEEGATTVTFGPNNGQFTDLTPVYGNYDIYAKYSKAA